MSRQSCESAQLDDDRERLEQPSATKVHSAGDGDSALRCDRRNRMSERGQYSGWFLLKFRRIDGGSGWSRRVLQQVAGAAMAGLPFRGAKR